MWRESRWAGPVLFGVVVLAVAVYLSGRTVDFQVYYLGTADFFAGIRPVYGALSGQGFPLHYRYPPLFLFLFWPMTLLPMRVGAAIWVGAKCVVLLWVLRSMRARLDLRPEYRWVPVLLAGPFVVQEFQYGNVQFFVFALLAASLLLSRTRPLASGAGLALAASIKVWPLFFFPVLAVRRDWKTLGTAAVLTAGLTFLPAFWFGPGTMVDLLGQWGRQELSVQAGETQIWYPSQSLRGVLSRYLTEIDYSRVPDSEYARELASLGYELTPDANYARVHLVAFDPAAVRLAWMVLSLAACAALLGLGAATRRSAGLAVYGAAIAGLVLLQPFTQKYALSVLLWPALVAGSVLGRQASPRWVRPSVWTAAVLVAVQPFFSGTPIQRHLQVAGLDFLAACLLAAVMAWAALSGADEDRAAPDGDAGDGEVAGGRPVSAGRTRN